MNPSSIRLPLLIGAPAYHDRRSLRRNGTPANGPSRARRIRGLEPVVVELVDDGIEPWVQRVDPLDRRERELAGGDVAALDELREAEAVVLVVLGEDAR